MANEDLIDYYSLLRIAHSASPNTIKAAYHRALLRVHPDKIRQRADDPAPLEDVGLLHDAFLTLSSETLRSAYDAQGKLNRRTDPRPAQVVSLDRFECSDPEGSNGGAISTRWTLGCRCGGKYEVTEDHLERGLHLAECGSCSEVIWVGYEVAKEVDGSEAGQLETRSKSRLNELLSTSTHLPSDLET
jgi:diphthamide biosynthesis protein 4